MYSSPFSHFPLAPQALLFCESIPSTLITKGITLPDPQPLGPSVCKTFCLPGWHCSSLSPVVLPFQEDSSLSWCPEQPQLFSSGCSGTSTDGSCLTALFFCLHHARKLFPGDARDYETQKIEADISSLVR